MDDSGAHDVSAGVLAALLRGAVAVGARGCGGVGDRFEVVLAAVIGVAILAVRVTATAVCTKKSKTS